MRKTFIGLTLLASGLTVSAQAQSDGIPAEFPPSSFEGNQFVDSQGCAFIRAGISGVVTWVPRVDRQRNQLCHFQPTFAVVAEEVAPEVEATVMAEADAVPEAEDVIDAPVTTALAPLEIEVPVARQITQVAPVAAPMIEAPAEPEIPRMTLAQVCAAMAANGKTYINAATGQPVQCSVTTARATPKISIPFFTQPEIPASNPTTSVRNVPNPPAGYRRVWSDGRLNTQRGIPSAKSQ